MAGWHGHVAGGIVLGSVYEGVLKIAVPDTFARTNGILTQWQLFVGLLVIAVLFALWPDVDTNSKGQNIFFGLAFAVDILLILSGRTEAAAYLGLLAMTPIVGHHRGWTHSKWAMVLVPLPIVLVPYAYKPALLHLGVLFYGVAVAGYFSHLLLDGLITKHIRIKT